MPIKAIQVLPAYHCHALRVSEARTMTIKAINPANGEEFASYEEMVRAACAAA